MSDEASLPDRAGVGGARAVVVSLAVITGASMVFAAVAHGVWYDENWTLFMAAHDLSWPRALTERWLIDLHPPLFPAFAWAIEPLTGDSVVLGRIANILPLAVLLATLVVSARGGQSDRRFAVMYGALLLTNPWTIRYFAEFRSYFAQICLAATIVAAARHLFEIRSGGRVAPSLFVLLAVAIVILLNLHYVGAYLALVLLLTLIAALAIAGRPRWAALVAAPTMVGLALLAASYVAQRNAIADIGSHFHTRTSNAKALMLIVTMVGLGSAANVAALLQAAIGVRSAGRDRSFLLWSLVALSGIAAAAMVFNVVRPTLLPRYLTIIVPVAAAPVAELATMGSARVMGLLIAANAAVLAVGSAYWTGKQKNWEAAAAFLAEQAGRCPGTIVHAVLPWTVQPGWARPQPNEAEVNRRAYRRLSRQFRFTLAPWGSSSVSVNCPTMVWAGHYFGPPPSPVAIAARAGLQLTPEALRSARPLLLGDGMVVAYPAPAAP